MINIVVLVLSATNKETVYEQLVQAAGKREGCHGPIFPFFLACVETSLISLVSLKTYFSCFAENVCTQRTLFLSHGLRSPATQAAPV